MPTTPTPSQLASALTGKPNAAKQAAATLQPQPQPNRATRRKAAATAPKAPSGPWAPPQGCSKRTCVGTAQPLPTGPSGTSGNNRLISWAFAITMGTAKAPTVGRAYVLRAYCGTKGIWYGAIVLPAQAKRIAKAAGIKPANGGAPDRDLVRAMGAACTADLHGCTWQVHASGGKYRAPITKLALHPVQASRASTKAQVQAWADLVLAT